MTHHDTSFRPKKYSRFTAMHIRTNRWPQFSCDRTLWRPSWLQVSCDSELLTLSTPACARATEKCERQWVNPRHELHAYLDRRFFSTIITLSQNQWVSKVWRFCMLLDPHSVDHCRSKRNSQTMLGPLTNNSTKIEDMLEYKECFASPVSVIFRKPLTS